MTMSIEKASLKDVNDMVALSYDKRLAYEKIEPTFWRHAPDAETKQANWFKTLLSNKGYIILTAKTNDIMQGFIIGQHINAPEVYAPSGLSLMIDDFCVKDDNWTEIGSALLKRLKEEAKLNNYSQLIICSGAHDIPKNTFLKSQALNLTSNWYIGQI